MTATCLLEAVPFRDGALAGTLRDADRAITLAINNFDSVFTDALMPALSNRLVWVPFYLLLFWYICRRVGFKRGVVILVAVAMCMLAIDQFANLIKVSVQRFRPCWDEFMVNNGLKILEKRGGKYGFFSAHAATTAGLATSVLYFVKKCWGEGKKFRLLSFLFAFWVTGVSISRVYVGKHFVGDIIVGAFAGIIIAWLISWLVHWAITKFFPKFVN